MTKYISEVLHSASILSKLYSVCVVLHGRDGVCLHVQLAGLCTLRSLQQLDLQTLSLAACADRLIVLASLPCLAALLLRFGTSWQYDRQQSGSVPLSAGDIVLQVTQQSCKASKHRSCQSTSNLQLRV